jgi:hypothetical protein
MSILGTDGGSSKAARSPMSVRSVDPSKAFPSLRENRNSGASPLVKLAFVSDVPYPGSRVTDSMLRSWIPTERVSDVLTLILTRRLVACSSDLVGHPGCIVQIVISQVFGILPAAKLDVRAFLWLTSFTATCINENQYRLHGLSYRARVSDYLSPSYRTHMHSTSTIIETAPPLRS